MCTVLYGVPMEYLYISIPPDLPVPKNDYPAKVTRTLNQMVAEGLARLRGQ